MLAELIEYCGTDLTAVNAARVSFANESDWEIDQYQMIEEEGRIRCEVTRLLSDKDIKLIKYLAKNRHDSCFEHQTITLRLKVPIFIARQIHRHRTFSYNEVSRRYVKENLEFYWPDKWRKAADNVKQGSSDEEAVPFVIDPPGDLEAYEKVYGKIKPTHPEELAKSVAMYAVMQYQRLLDQGHVCAEQARMILPQNLYTEFYMTGNLRNWIHFLKLRLHPHAQKEVRDIATQCADIISGLYPVSYEALMTAS